MIERRQIVVALVMAGVLSAGSTLFGQEKAGTRQDVEKRLKAAERPKAATPLDTVVNTLFAAHTFEQVALSPDGNSIAWVETVHTKRGTFSGASVIYVKNLKSGAPPRRIGAGVADSFHAEGGVAWSPDSHRLAFLSDASKKGQQQLYEVSAAGGPAKVLTHVKGFLASSSWSPDGKTIAVLFTENATRASGPLVAETPQVGEIKDSFFEQRLALVDVATAKLRQLTPADTYVYEYDWAPDGLRFAVTAALGNGDNNWWVAELYTLEGASGLMKSIYKPHLQIANPVWSPDGERIAFIEGLMSDAGLTGGDIFSVDAGGGEVQDLTPEIKGSPSWIGWTPEKKIIFTEFVGGDVGLASVDPQSKKVGALWRGGGDVGGGGGGGS